MSTNSPNKDLPQPRPTGVELEILEVLWELGPSAMGKIHEACVATRPSSPGYTTTQKMIQVMRDKGLVEADKSTRPPLYRAAELREKTQLNLLDDVTQRAFGGSAKNLVLSLLDADRLNQDELDEVKALIAQAQNNQTSSES